MSDLRTFTHDKIDELRALKHEPGTVLAILGACALLLAAFGVDIASR
jgi:hypothetical protein